MGYAEKVAENERALRKCTDISAFNVGASRAYYCAFIKIKSFLIANGYDYDSFLMAIGRSQERDYSHGTIKKALFDCLLGSGKTISNVSQINVLDNLYRKRRTADYEEKEISKTQFEDSLRELSIVLAIIGA